ncbi:MAG: hypothetical protein LBV47_00580 [Bacteroidales bacterium]|nr:hypothetical protein [Bacteroidales bacterium]
MNLYLCSFVLYGILNNPSDEGVLLEAGTCGGNSIERRTTEHARYKNGSVRCVHASVRNCFELISFFLILP